MVSLRSSEYGLVTKSLGTVPPLSIVGGFSSKITPLSSRKSKVAAFYPDPCEISAITDRRCGRYHRTVTLHREASVRLQLKRQPPFVGHLIPPGGLAQRERLRDVCDLQSSDQG